MTSPADKGRPGLLRWFGAVRARAAVVSVLIVGVAFVFSALGVISLLGGSLYQSATNTAKAEAMAISSLITTRGLVPRSLPISTEEMAVQVVGPNGNVLRSSRNITGQAAMVNLSPPTGKVATSTGVVLRVRRFTHVRLDLDDRFVVAAVGLHGPGSSRAVLVAYSLGAADHAIWLVELSLGIALPVLALLVGVLVWALTGWALRPVEVIRAEVAELSATDLRRRVPEPPVQDEIGRLARTMNAMLRRLEVSSDRQRQLVADVSHELRNPLAALQAQLEVAAAHPGAASGSMIEGSIVEVNRMSQLVDDLLTLARLDEGMLRLRPADVDLDELILEQADRLRANGKVEVSVKGVMAARARGDEAQLSRVVANLADNAQRYARNRVEFGIASQGDSYYLTVSDDGRGVPWFERERIFERFVRLDTARIHDGTGAGLGLAIVREIISAHNGEVWVEDAQPGARFIVRLPRSGPSGTSAAGPPRRKADARSAETVQPVAVERLG
ncbi:MAG TPA: ATP-binding protein [Acidimicrobiales bacterium]|nr:ATP-binding protein [Acidimicrobiales bacterium]